VGDTQQDVAGSVTGRAPRFQYSDLYSPDWAGMRAVLDQKSIKGFHGLTTWKVSYQYRWKTMPDGRCVVTEVVPSFEGEIRMPRWVPGERVGSEQRREWERYSAALKVHEEGHAENGQRLAAAIAQLSGMQVTCGAADAAVKQRFDALLQQAQAADLEYDRRTNHGATQGATLR
jgi:predicted secreted Zn-dependent protease